MDTELSSEQLLRRLEEIKQRLAELATTKKDWHTKGQWEYMELLDEQEYLYADLAAKEKASE